MVNHYRWHPGRCHLTRMAPRCQSSTIMGGEVLLSMTSPKCFTSFQTSIGNLWVSWKTLQWTWLDTLLGWRYEVDCCLHLRLPFLYMFCAGLSSWKFTTTDCLCLHRPLNSSEGQCNWEDHSSADKLVSLAWHWKVPKVSITRCIQWSCCNLFAI